MLANDALESQRRIIGAIPRSRNVHEDVRAQVQLQYPINWGATKISRNPLKETNPKNEVVLSEICGRCYHEFSTEK